MTNALKDMVRPAYKYLKKTVDNTKPLNRIDINDVALISRQETDWIVRKMQFLDIDSCGSCDGGKLAYIRLKNGLVFYSFPTAEWQRRIFHARRDEFPANLTEDALNVAFDIVNRFIRENVGAHIPALTFHLAMLGPDAALIDVGAYIGYGAMRYAMMAKQGGKILCVEAESASIDVMNRMIEENKLSNRMKTVQCALTDEDGTITLNVDTSPGNRQGNIILNSMQDEVSGVQYDLGQQYYTKTTIPAKKLDSLLSEMDWITPDDAFVMHLGINGSELKALQGAPQTLKNWKSYGIKVSTRYFDPAEGPIHDKVKKLLAANDGVKVLDIDPHVYAYRWNQQ